MKRDVTMWQKLQRYALGIGVLLLGATVVMVFASVTTAFLILRDRPAPVGATPPAALPPYRAKWPSYQGAVRQLPSPPAEAGRTPTDPASREPAAAYRNPDDPTADQVSASEMPRPETSPAPEPGGPIDSENASPIANGQSIFGSRSDPKVSSAVERTLPRSSTRTKALETIDPRELLRQGKLPK
jgi:hypothetical protein